MENEYFSLKTRTFWEVIHSNRLCCIQFCDLWIFCPFEKLELLHNMGSTGATEARQKSGQNSCTLSTSPAIKFVYLKKHREMQNKHKKITLNSNVFDCSGGKTLKLCSSLRTGSVQFIPGHSGETRSLTSLICWPKDPSLSQFSAHGCDFNIDKCCQENHGRL